MSGVVPPAGSCVVLFVILNCLMGNAQLPCVSGKFWQAGASTDLMLLQDHPCNPVCLAFVAMHMLTAFSCRGTACDSVVVGTC